MTEEQDILSVGTLTKDASLFFNQMENLIGSSRLQHTPSMMELPSGFLQQIIRERDEEYAKKHKNGHRIHDDLKLDDEDEDFEDNDEDEDDSDYFNEDEEPVPNAPISSSTNTVSTTSTTATSTTTTTTNNTSTKPSMSQRSSNHGGGRLHLIGNDSEDIKTEIDDMGHSRKSVHNDNTPIVKPLPAPPIEPPSFNKSISETRRRSGGVTKLSEDTEAAKMKPSQTALSQSTLTNINDDDDIDLDFFNDDYDFVDEDDEDEVDDDGEMKMNMNDESEHSHTMDVDEDKWIDITTENESKFTECNIRFEEDEWNDGKKPPASEFMSLRFFFQFVYDRFHLFSQFLLDTSLPTYSEWKKIRKVRIRNASLKTVDYALKDCIECVDSIKSVVRNCIILCLDEKQPNKQIIFNKCKEPQIIQTTFNNGNYSIMAAWDLFDNGSTPSINDWTMALNLEHGIAQKLSSCLPDLSHLNAEMKAVSLAYHNGKTYKFHILSEFLNENPAFLKFGAGPIEWKIIKSKFVSKHGKKFNNNILKAFDTLNYFVNPVFKKLNDLMNDKNDKYVSKRRIIAEPIMWLYYMVSFLIQRQEKLQNLYITAMTFKGDNNNKGQKLNSLISNLAKQAKDESERLRAIMAKLPGKDDLKQTLIQLVKDRDPNNTLEYTQSLQIYTF